MNNISYFTGKIHPDHSFSIGLVAKKKKAVLEVEYDRDFENQHDSYSYQVSKYGRTETRTHQFFDKPVTPDRFIRGTKSSQKRGSYGSRGITGYGRKAVSNIALLLQKRYGRRRLGFVTCTIPSIGETSLRVVIRRWGDVVRRYFQELRRICHRRGVAFNYISVTEIQEKRFRNCGLPYPHLHFVYVCKNGNDSKFTISASELRMVWKRVLHTIVASELSGDDWSEVAFGASIDAQVVKKSASAYLGKYLSKGCKVVSSMQEAGYTDFPGQWWSASMQCKKMLKDSIIRMDAKTAEDIFYRLADYLEEGLVTWCNYIFVEHAGEERCFGCCGRLSKKAYEAFGGSG